MVDRETHHSRQTHSVPNNLTSGHFMSKTLPKRRLAYPLGWAAQHLRHKNDLSITHKKAPH